MANLQGICPPFFYSLERGKEMPNQDVLILRLYVSSKGLYRLYLFFPVLLQLCHGQILFPYCKYNKLFLRLQQISRQKLSYPNLRKNNEIFLHKYFVFTNAILESDKTKRCSTRGGKYLSQRKLIKSRLYSILKEFKTSDLSECRINVDGFPTYFPSNDLLCGMDFVISHNTETKYLYIACCCVLTNVIIKAKKCMRYSMKMK